MPRLFQEFRLVGLFSWLNIRRLCLGRGFATLDHALDWVPDQRHDGQKNRQDKAQNDAKRAKAKTGADISRGRCCQCRRGKGEGGNTGEVHFRSLSVAGTALVPDASFKIIGGEIHRVADMKGHVVFRLIEIDEIENDRSIRVYFENAALM